MLIGISNLLVFNVQAGSTLSAGVYHVCGIKNDDSTVLCWGDNSKGQTDAPGGTFLEISAGYWFNCGLKSDYTIVCWGKDIAGETSPPGDTIPKGKQFTQIETGAYHACALQSDGNVRCWGNNSNSQSVYLPGPFKQLALGDSHSCGLRNDGSVECWGYDGNGQASTPSDTFTSIVAGYRTTCGVKEDEVAVCWGYNSKTYGYLNDIAVSIYGDNDGTANQSKNAPIIGFCGIRADNTVSCPDMDTVPSGKFSAIVTSGDETHPCHQFCGQLNAMHHYEFRGFACGIRENNLVACWGYNTKGRATPPVGVEIKHFVEPPPPPPSYTQADLDKVRQEAQSACKANPAFCGIDNSGEATAAVINQDLSLHVSKAEYNTLTGTRILWVDLIFGGTNEEGNFMWILSDYGEVK